jgi:hypothetical protein
MEVIVASVIAVIAVLGLAHSFGVGRALINRFEVARDALGLAQRRMESLSVLPVGAPELAVGNHGPYARTLGTGLVAAERWSVTWVDDSVDNSPSDPDPNDYKRLVLTVGWSQAGVADSIQLERVFPAP